MGDMGDCNICCEPYNKSNRKHVQCNFCQGSACTTCVQRYLLSVDDPECMACKKPWTSDMVDGALTKAFVKGALKKHREDVLMNREKGLLPATQIVVERMNRQKETKKMIKDMERTLRDARRQLYMNRLNPGHSEEEEAERRQFIKHCPAQGCRGFLSTQYKCGLCSIQVCPECHEIKAKDQEHQCNSEVVASVKAIQTDSKPCPKCGCMIYRIYGCDQMFCTAPGCETAFSWRTLRILNNERIHNPHYYEFLQSRRQGGGGIPRELDDIPCGGLPTVHALSSTLQRREGLPLNATTVEKRNVLAKYRELFDMHRFAMHVADFELRRYPAMPDVVNPSANQDVRIRFLTGAITDAKFKEILQQREKSRKKCHAIHQILATVANVSSDMFRHVVIENAREAVIRDTMEHLCALCDYANTHLAAVSKRFGSAVPVLQKNWMTPLHTQKY